MNQGERAARERVEAVWAAIDTLSAEDLHTAPVPRLDLEDREVLLADLERLADRLGRGPLLDEARAKTRDGISRRFVDWWPVRPYGGSPIAHARTGDQVAIAMALEDLVSVAVMEDQLDPDDAEVLAGPGRLIANMEAGPTDERHADDEVADEADEADQADEADEADGAPSERDWAEADHGATVVQPDVELPVPHGMRIAFFGVIGVLGAVGALVVGVVDGQPFFGLLVAGAIAALCWTFATFRSASRQ